MLERVRVGVAGASWWADAMHLPSLKSHPRADVVAICARQRPHAEALAAKYGIEGVFTDHREMIEKGALDALVVSVPDDWHYPIVMDALAAGLHVVCEKPLASSAEQARQMFEKAEQARVKHMTYFTWRWIPHFRYLQSLIGEDYIGRVFHCHLTQTGGYGRDGRYAWRFDGRRANGILGDLGSHMIDLARWLVGEVGEVSAQLATLVEHAAPRAELVEAPAMPANDSALLGLRFASGAQGMIHVNAVQHRGAQGQKQTATFDGALGTLEASYGSATGSEIHGIRHDEDHFTHLPVPERFLPASRQHPYDVFRTEAAGDRLFIDAILEDRAISPSFYDGWKAQQVIEAALLSDREGRRVHIAEHQA